ncbi:hypothetical protein SNE40_002319 [Patella caerulea]|uniref:Uncharacterized protein n=1 Tax=Patella caerulea TaxID=87958 RepID=A0AAN8K5L3_PATCE
MKLSFILTTVLCLVESIAPRCVPCPAIPNHSAPPGYTRILYNETNEHIENPDRGFVYEDISYSSNPTNMSVSDLDEIRAKYGITMVRKQFVLDEFVTSNISSEFLQFVDNNLDNIQTAGFTAIIRFSYTFNLTTAAPYGDATKDWILQHIEQLTPIFHKYEGILSSVEAGFIGVRGEWFYTTHFGDPMTLNYTAYPEFGYPEDLWQDRKDVFEALLDAIPASIQVQVPYPQTKVDLLGDTTPAGSFDEYLRSDKGRTGHHNECFLASDTDGGTYQNKTFEYPYLEEDTKYCMMGGQTCEWKSGDHQRSDCTTALSEMAMFHWSYLNQNFYTGILDEWKRQGCYEEIHRRLGYRYLLTEAVLPDSVLVGETLCFVLYIKNSGFGTPVKPLNMSLLLHSPLTGQFYAAHFYRPMLSGWRPEKVTKIQASFQMPPFMFEDDYDVYLMIRNKDLPDRSDYYILFANENVPDHSAGLNNMQHSIHVYGNYSDICGAGIYPFTAPNPSRYKRSFQGFTGGPIG